MPHGIDGLTSSTLRHLRERWWDESFTEFLCENLQPRAGHAILDIGCGVGTAEVNLAKLDLARVNLVAIDVVPPRVREAVATARAYGIRAAFAVADAGRLPFRDAVFDSTFCVAVLQHLQDPGRAILEFARVTKPGGRVLAVEPDNRTRYWHSSVASGGRAIDLGLRFFADVARTRGDVTNPAVGPTVPEEFARHGIEPLAVHLFPVSVSRLGAPAALLWQARRDAVRQALDGCPDTSVALLASEYLEALDRYADEAFAAGPSFVEIQNTMLFATIGQRRAA